VDNLVIIQHALIFLPTTTNSGAVNDQHMVTFAIPESYE